MSVALISTPSQLYNFPTSSIFFLKGCLSKEGIDSSCYDLNFDFLSKFKEAGVKWCEFGTDYNPEFEEFIQHYCNQLIDYDWIGISVFTYNSQVFTKKLLEILRPMTNAKIVLGGLGLTNSGSDLECHSFNFGDYMISLGLADYQISGEGDVALPSLINSKTWSSDQIDDLTDLPIPDYSDIDFSKYPSNVVTITGSRGCVRKCTFCDVAGIWKKFRYRPGKEIANEIVEMYYEYGVDTIHFSDSLVNGSMKAFREMCTELVKANVPVKWRGLFIFRANMTDSDWDLIRDSGCDELWIGIESGSEKIRNDMRKKFTNVDMYKSIEELGKRNIKMTYLMMVGYPTETDNDFEDTLDLIRWSERYKKLIEVRTNIVMVVKNTELYNDIPWYGNVETWRYKNTEGVLTYADRFLRWKEMVEVTKESGLKVDNRIDQLEAVLKIRLDKELHSTGN